MVLPMIYSVCSMLNIGFIWFLYFGSVPEFEASKYKVTNGEFLKFVESGGYQQRDLWTDEGEERKVK